MRSRAVRAALTLLAAGAIGVAAYFYWTIQTRLDAGVERTAAFHQPRIAATRDAFELRSSQQAYVAIGQNETFWFDKVTALTDSLQAALPALKKAATVPEAQLAVDEAIEALREFTQGDKRIRGYVSSGQKLLASDVIFSDGLESTARIISALEKAGHATTGPAADASRAARREQWMAAGAAGAVVLLVILLLVPVPGATGTTPVVEAGSVPDDTISLDLRPSVRPPPAVVPATPVPVVAGATPAIQIGSLASVCMDLARLSDTATLPAILEKAAAALDASGLVLWVADADRNELMPIAAHGYPASVLSRMGTLRTDAENATAAAFRTGLLQTVTAGTASPGAIAAPLVSPSGCLGVLSAEVRHDGEHQPARLAAASILAAQLATLVGPPAAGAEERLTQQG